MLDTLRFPIKVMVLPLTPLSVREPEAMFPLIPEESVMEPALLRISAVPLRVMAPE